LKIEARRKCNTFGVYLEAENSIAMIKIEKVIPKSAARLWGNEFNKKLEAFSSP
jgi:hypothetical protein